MTHVTSEQAKWLKEIGFDEVCEDAYLILENGDVIPYNEFGLKLDWNKHKSSIDYKRTFVSRPEKHKVVEWLRVNRNIDLQPICNYGQLGRTYRMGIIFINKEGEVDTVFLRPIDTPFKFIEFNSPQEAYSEAFDYIKENNLIWKHSN